MFKPRDNSRETGLKKAFSKIKDENNDHLDAINQLTKEIQDLFEFCAELEKKYDKLKESYDELQMFRYQMTMYDKTHFSNTILTLNEQKLFILMYMLGEKASLSYEELCKKTDLSYETVKDSLSSLSKKVPLLVEVFEGKMLFNIEPRFRELQTKENIIRVEEAVSKGIFEKPLDNFF